MAIAFEKVSAGELREIRKIKKEMETGKEKIIAEVSQNKLRVVKKSKVHPPQSPRR